MQRSDARSSLTLRYRQVGTTYKSLRTKLKQNEEAIKAGRTKKRYRGLDKPPKFVSRTVTLNYQRDYSFTKDQKVSVITLDGRIKVNYQGYSKHLEMIRSGVAKIGAAKIWYSKPAKTYYLLVSLEVEVPDLTPSDIKRHCTSHQVVTPSTLIGLEDLTHIRERTRPKKTGKKASKKQRKANDKKAKWSFAQLHGFIDYKAVLSGSLAVKVDAHYTSPACPCCGHTSRENRPDKGLTFVCQQCGYTLHADLVGARNVALRVLLFHQEWESTGRCSAAPDASGDETKTDYRLRYSGLRWSQDAIPTLNSHEALSGRSGVGWGS